MKAKTLSLHDFLRSHGTYPVRYGPFSRASSCMVLLVIVTFRLNRSIFLVLDFHKHKRYQPKKKTDGFKGLKMNTIIVIVPSWHYA